MDVIFLPIPAILLVAFLALGLARHGSRAPTASEKTGFMEHRTPTRFGIFLYYLDIALAFCQGGMQVLEITRLAISNEGVGLLPSELQCDLAKLVSDSMNSHAGRDLRILFRHHLPTETSPQSSSFCWPIHDLLPASGFDGDR